MQNGKQVLYCNMLSALELVMYSDANLDQPIPSDIDEEYLQYLLETKSDIIYRLYNTRCANCKFRKQCSIFESVHCELNSETFDDQIEIYHNHAKELYEDAWNDYVKDFD